MFFNFFFVFFTDQTQQPRTQTHIRRTQTKIFFMFFPNPRSNQTNFIKQKSRNRNKNTWLIISQIYTKPTSTTNEFRSQTNLRFFTMSNLTFSEPQSHINHFDRLPNSILILIFNKISDVKALGWCCVVSHRFHSIVP